MSETMQYVAFKLGNEEYAVDILAVQEIIRWSNITRVPKAPHFVKGVINLRGTIIPLIDSRIRFRMPNQQVTELTRIIIFKIDESPIGMTVDHVTGVITLDSDQIEMPKAAQSVEDEYISSIGKIDDRLIIILNLPRVLDFGIQE